MNNDQVTEDLNKTVAEIKKRFAATVRALGKVKKQPPDLTAGEFNRSE